MKNKSVLTPPYKNNGFTLAETLITLVIIGVIAAITVPTLITKYQKEQTVTRLKKAYSALAQTTNRAIMDYGPVKTWEITDEGSAEASKTFVNKYMIPYLSILKAPLTLQEGNYDTTVYALNGEERHYGDNKIRFYLSDGTSITVEKENEYRMVLYIDINGDKKPNKWGKDIFQINYYTNSGKLLFSGSASSRGTLLSSQTHNCNKATTGLYCGALILKDGWRIADDYPW
ncbi:type II secretion system protein [bacterium]|nr:type II secretion system protein [bacterium]